jgi:hypothetical protein
MFYQLKNNVSYCFQIGQVLSQDTQLVNDLNAMKADLIELKKENMFGMYCRGVKEKFKNSPCEAVNSIAGVIFTSMLTLTVTAGMGYCAYNAYIPTPSYQAMPVLRKGVVEGGVIFLVGVAGVCASFKHHLEKEVTDNILHGYYDRVSQIIDHRIGSRVSEENKKQVKEKISQLLNSTPFDQIEKKLLNLVTEIITDYKFGAF